MMLALLPQRFMESKKSLFVLVPPILSIKNSMASMDPSGLRTLRRIHILFSRSRSTSSSSLRVPEAAISIAGKIRLSARRLSRWTSMFPVPLNSSKITSSMRLPVSTMAVHDRQAAAVLDVPGRAEEPLGALQRVGVQAAGEDLAAGRGNRVVGPCQPREAVEQD